MNTTVNQLRLLKPFAVARLENITGKGRRRIAKIYGQRSDVFCINNREGANYYFFAHRAADVVNLLKGEASGLVWEITHGQFDKSMPSSTKQWAERISCS